jgi:hypothetical protein
MKRIIFKNAFFHWAIVSILSLLLVWNLYKAVTTPKLVGLLPILIQILLLTLILRRHEYAKIGIKLWAIMFLISGSGLQILGGITRDLSDSFANLVLQHYLVAGVTILLGIVIVNYTNRTVEIVETAEEAESTSAGTDL